MTKVSKKSTDPRVLRTRHLLREALFELLAEKHFDAITVLEITKRAGLNAATFYLHYQDKWEMVNSVAVELSALVEAAKTAFVGSPDDNGWTSLLERKIFDHIEQYRDFYRLMLGRNGVPSVRNELQQQFQMLVRVALDQLPDTFKTEIPPGFVEHYFAGAYIAVIQWWLSSKDPISAVQVVGWIGELWRTTLSDEFIASLKFIDEPSASAGS